MRVPTVLKNSTLYTFASFLQKGIGFFLLPIFTRFLTPEDYGVMNLLSSIAGFLSIIIMFSLHGAAKRFHFSYNTVKGRATVWGTIFLLVLINSLFWTAIVVVFHKYLIDPLTNYLPFWELTIMSLLATMLNPIYLLYQTWLQTIEDGKRFSINMLLNFALTTILNLVAVVYFKLGVKGLLLTNIIVATVFFVYSIIKFSRIVRIKIDPEITKKSFKYSLPLIPHNVSGYFSVMADRILLNKLASVSQLGIYSVANQFGIILNTITNSFNQAITPWFYKELSTGKVDENKLAQFTIGATLLCSVIAFTLAFYTPEIVHLMTTEAYGKAWQPVLFISFGYVLNGLYFYFSAPLFYSKPGKVLIVSMSQLTTNLLFNFWLIPVLGYIGAGLSFLLSMLASSVIALFLSSKYFPNCKYPWVKLYSLVAFFLVLSSTVFIIEIYINQSVFYKLLIKFIICIVLIMAVYSVFKNEIISIINRKK